MVRPRYVRWRFWNNYLVGIPWDRWRTLRAANPVDAGYQYRAAYLTALSVRNSFYRRQEERRYGAAVATTRIEERPLFVLGHWRTGTTYLHSLLACDTEQFAFPNSIQASYPYTFLCTEEAVRRQFAAFVPHTRPMDGMEISPDTPQEDEFALCTASWSIHALQRSPANLEEQILQRFARMYDAFFEEREQIPEGQFHEIRFEDLEQDPVGQVRAIYERLGLTGFDAVRPRLQQYVDSLAGYRRNQFADLSPELRRRVALAWQRSFDAWGYRI